MHKTLTLISAGLVGFVLAGCEQQQDNFGPADGLPQNEPQTEPDVQIGQGDPIDEPESDVQFGQGDSIDEPEPVSPSIEREIEPTVIRPDEAESGSVEPQDPANPPQN